MPFASSPTFGFVYRSTVGHFPAAFLLLIAAVKFLEGTIVAVVNFWMRKAEKDLDKIKKEKEGEEEEGKPLKEIEMKDMSGQENIWIILPQPDLTFQHNKRTNLT